LFTTRDTIVLERDAASIARKTQTGDEDAAAAKEDRDRIARKLAQLDAVRTATADKLAAITVQAPQAASALSSIGGIVGGATMNNAERLRQQHEEAVRTIMREQATLLAKIEANTEE
jgi:hypothetical protein